MGDHPMYGFGMLIDILKKKPRRIVFTEGADPRILEAASRLLAGTFLSPILVGDEEEIFKSAEESCFNIRGAEIVDPKKYDQFHQHLNRQCCSLLAQDVSSDLKLMGVRF